MMIESGDSGDSLKRFIYLTHKPELNADEIAEYKMLQAELECPIEDHFDSDSMKELESQYGRNEIDPKSPAFYIIAQIDSIVSKIEKGIISESDHAKLKHYFHSVEVRINSTKWNSCGKKKVGRPVKEIDL